jgi:hypothetical protein
MVGASNPIIPPEPPPPALDETPPLGTPGAPPSPAALIPGPVISILFPAMR